MDVKANFNQAKQLFIIQFDHCIDIITNSSSELFVLENQEGAIIEELIKSIYEDYEKEYEKPISLRDASEDQLESYLSNIILTKSWYADNMELSEYSLIDGFTFDELYEPSRWQTGRGKLKYDIKEDLVSPENRDRLISAIDPQNKIYLLYSKEENPNWEMQEALMDIGTRHHLG